MKFIPTPIQDLILVEPDIFGDDRGYFMETWQVRKYAASGIGGDFVQDNLSFSRRGVLRGLHFQNPNPQGKLVYVLEGEVFDVAVDIRFGSPTFGRWHGVLLSGENKRQFWVPAGFAHGFCVVSETALFAYKCTDLYAPEHECVVRWDDPTIGISWPIKDAQLSERDKVAPTLTEISPEKLFRWAGQ